MPDDEVDEFLTWMRSGRDRGWVSEIVCNTHSGLPSTEEEDEQWDEGYDPCVFAVRVWVE